MPGSLGARDATGQGGRGQHPSCERWRQNALTPVERSAHSCSLLLTREIELPDRSPKRRQKLSAIRPASPPAECMGTGFRFSILCDWASRLGSSLERGK